MKANVGLIPGIIGDEIKQDLWGTIEKVAAIGYKGIEGGGQLAEGDLAENRKRLEDLGLRFVTLSGRREALEENLDQIIRTAQALGAEHITEWWRPCESKEQVLQDAAFFNEVGAKISAAGLKLCYHNHDHEFKTVFDGQRCLDILIENTEPGNVFIELDVAWVTYGGEDPVEYLAQHGSRIPVIHLKDIADINERGQFTAVGTGCVKVKESVEAALAVGVKWVIVEQDRPNNLTPMESITASYLNIKELGLV